MWRRLVAAGVTQEQRNIEAGEFIQGPAFAKQLVTQLQSLIDGGYVRQLR